MLKIETPGQCVKSVQHQRLLFGVRAVSFEEISDFIGVSIADFEQLNAVWKN